MKFNKLTNDKAKVIFENNIEKIQFYLYLVVDLFMANFLNIYNCFAIFNLKNYQDVLKKRYF